MELIIKKIRATDFEHSHTKVFKDEEYLGYYMFDNMARTLKWVFTPVADSGLSYFCTKKQDEILGVIESQLLKNPVTLYQHFGIVKHLN